VGKDDTDPAFVIEDAFLKVLASKDTRKLIRKAVKEGKMVDSMKLEELGKAAVKEGLCSEDEAKLFVEAELARSKAIQVDDYPPEFFENIQGNSIN
jgi:acyl-CoA dehydrogenase